MICVSVVYANRPGSRFDRNYYTTQHLKLAERLLKPFGLIEVRMSFGVSDLAGAPPPFLALCEIHFESRQAFDEAMRINGQALFDDARNYTDVEPILQLSLLP